MFLFAKRTVLLLCMLQMAVHPALTQNYSTRDNYTGDWESPSTWDPIWATPETEDPGYDFTINGHITINGSLEFFKKPSNVIINDTLVILGDLYLCVSSNLTINSHGVLIVRGDFVFETNTHIEINNYIVITGYIFGYNIGSGSTFISNTNPAKVFVGGNLMPATITKNRPDYPALNCDSPVTIPYPNTGCGYGNMDDFINDPLYPFFQSTCANVKVTSNSPICTGSSINLTSTGGISYSWIGPNGFTSSAQNFSISGATAEMSGAYTVTVTTESGCTVQATADVVVNDLPVVSAGTDVTIPYGTSITLDASVTGTGPFAYNWSPSAQLVNASMEDPTTVIQTSTTVFALNATSTTTSCSGKDEVTVTISGGPLGSSSTATPGIICSGEEVQLHALASGGSGSYTYSWTSTPAGFSSTMLTQK